MRMLRVIGWLCGGLSALPACGGRTLGGRPPQEETGGAAGSGAGTPGRTGSSGTAGAAGGGTSIGGTPQIDEPFVVGNASSEPPFEVPLWLTTTWEEYKTVPLYKVCEQGWSAEETLAKIAEQDLSLGNAEHHELFDLLPTINNVRAPETTEGNVLGKRAFMFELATGQTAVAFVVDLKGSSFLLRYLLVEQDCRIRNVGSYAEGSDGLEDCGTRLGNPLWGIPPLPAYAHCPSSAGFYGFSGQVTTDFCRRSAQEITGVLNYRQTTASQAELSFVEFPLPKLLSQGYSLSIKGERASADDGENNGSCTAPIHTSIVLEDSSISVTDEQGFCQGDQFESCRWVMSGNVYGPLR